VLALDTFGGRPSQLANPQLGPVRLRTTGFGPGEGGGLRRGQATLAKE
jgi:hypothetical protein